MKTIIRLITLGATVAMLALPVAAKSLVPRTFAGLQDQCTQENKDAYYAAFRENRTTDQAKAYDNAKKYLACPPGEVTETTQNIINYLKKWVTAYEDLMEKQKLPQLLYNEHKYPEAYELGRKILSKEPENLKVLVDLGANGYLVAPLKNASLNAEALNYARKALALLESGKTVDDWTPLAGANVALAYLNYTIGSLTLDQDPASALKNLLKAAQFDTPLKKAPHTYAFIGVGYETGPYAKQSEEYKKTIAGNQNETPESKLALANINQLVDRMVDAYARAVALAGEDAKLASAKTVWTESLTTWYKYRNNNSDAGMKEMVATVLSKPLPPEPTPLTSLPSSTPAATPIGTASTNGTTASTTAPTGSQPTQSNGGAAKPPAKTPGGPNKPRNNHR